MPITARIPLINPSPTLCLKVALPVPVPGLFDYLPFNDNKALETLIGCRVRVPFGRRTLIGWIAAIGAPVISLDKLKPVISVIDGTSLLTDEALKTLYWTSQYYQAPIGEVFNTAVPALLRDGKPLPECHEYAWQLTPAGTLDWTKRVYAVGFRC